MAEIPTAPPSSKLEEAIDEANALVDELGPMLCKYSSEGRSSLVAGLFQVLVDQLPSLIKAEEVLIRSFLAKVASFPIASDNNFTPAHYAAEKGHVATLQYLVAAGANLRSQTNTPDGSMPVHVAVEYDQLKVLQFLISYDGDMAEAQGGLGQTPLMTAAFKGNILLAEYLIVEKHVDPEILSKDRRTALWIAVQSNHLAVAEILVNEGHADIEKLFPINETTTDAEKSSISLLHNAALQGFENIVRWLLTKAPHQVNYLDVFGRSALFCAVAGGHMSMVQFLVETAGASLEIQDQDEERNFLIHIAVSCSPNVAIVQYLLAKKPEFRELKNGLGDTPLETARREGRPEMEAFIATEVGKIRK